MLTEVGGQKVVSKRRHTKGKVSVDDDVLVALTRAINRMGSNGKANSSDVSGTTAGASQSRAYGGRNPAYFQQDKAVTLRGSDYLGPLSAKGTDDSSSRVLQQYLLSPHSFPGTRLETVSGLYEFYRFKKCQIRYVPAVPTTLSCQLAGYIDTDPTDTLDDIYNQTDLVRNVVANKGSREWNFYAPMALPMPMRKDDQLFFTGGGDDLRLNTQGKVIIVQTGEILDFNGNLVKNNLKCGQLYLDWEVEFSKPQMSASHAKLAGFGTVRVMHVVDNSKRSAIVRVPAGGSCVITGIGFGVGKDGLPIPDESTVDLGEIPTGLSSGEAETADLIAGHKWPLLTREAWGDTQVDVHHTYTIDAVAGARDFVISTYWAGDVDGYGFEVTWGNNDFKPGFGVLGDAYNDVINPIII